jgi:hypothetical protein
MQRAQYFCHTLNKFGHSRQILINILNNKVHGNPVLSETRSYMRKDGWTDTAKTTGAFSDYANAPSTISKRSYKSNTTLSESSSDSVNYSWVRSLHQKHCNQFSKNNSPQKMRSSPLPHSLLFFPRTVSFLH